MAMLTIDSMPNPLRTLTGKGSLLFLTRFVRLFAYGSLSVVLVFYLIGLGLSESQTGLLLTLTLVGDTVVSLKKAGVADSAVAYIGDDLPDIPLMLRAGLAAVGDAVLEV